MSDAGVNFQVRLIENAVMTGRAEFLDALLALDPAVMHRHVPPPSRVYGMAFTYAKAHLLPRVSGIWPMPDDLPHAAGSGDLGRVKGWFDAEGKPALGEVANHTPANDGPYCKDLRTWFGRAPSEQDVLETALAWAVVNNHFEVADFLLAHGADINTKWSSHEPASILHELVWHKNYEAMRFLIERGIDMTIVDYRWGGTAEGWAYHAAHDEKMARWLAEARRQREEGGG